MWKIDSENYVVFINIRLQKYIGSICSNKVEKLMLFIKKCDELDFGIYYFWVKCCNDLFIYSNKIDFKVVKGKILFYILY